MGSGLSRISSPDIEMGAFFREEVDDRNSIPKSDRDFVESGVAYVAETPTTATYAESRLFESNLELKGEEKRRKYVKPTSVFEESGDEVSTVANLFIETVATLTDEFNKTDYVKSGGNLQLTKVGFKDSGDEGAGGNFDARGYDVVVYKDETLGVSSLPDPKYPPTISIDKGAMTVASAKDWVYSASEVGYSITSDLAVSTGIHEFGHAVYFSLIHDPKALPKLNSYIKKYKTEKYKAVSIYGTVSITENSAESFALYSWGEETSSYGNKGYQDFKRLMKEVKLDYMYGKVKPKTIYNKVKPLTRGKKVFSDVKEVKKITPPLAPPRVARSFGLEIMGDKIVMFDGNKRYNATITSARKKRGYMTKTIGNVTYKINVKTGEFEEITK